MPYVDVFDENQIPTKARPIQINAQLLEYCKEEIKDLMNKNLIRKIHFIGNPNIRSIKNIKTFPLKRRKKKTLNVSNVAKRGI